MNARGTIYHKETGDVVAMAFPKFFNLGETDDVRFERLPLHLPYLAFEKLDGSLGVHYRHDGVHKVATRGAFFSSQAKRASEVIRRHDLSFLPEEINLLFEIILPENRIIVDYGAREELVLIGAFNTKNLAELAWSEVKEIAARARFALPREVSGDVDALARAAQSLPWQEEGWVIAFENGLRVKVKGAEYLKVAKTKAHLGPISVWEAMNGGVYREMLVGLPEEIRPDAEAIHAVLAGQLTALKTEGERRYRELGLSRFNAADKAERKAAAEIINRDRSIFRAYLFQRLAGKGREDGIILDLVRPVGNQYVDVGLLMTASD